MHYPHHLNEHIDDDEEVTDQSEGEEGVFSFDLPMNISFISYTAKRHEVLTGLLKLDRNSRASMVFEVAAAIVDPMTQPIEDEDVVVSLSLIAKCIIALCYDSSSILPKYELAMNLYTIVEATLDLLNCNNESKLRSLNNSDPEIDWKLRLEDWTPHGLNDQDLKLIYMVDCVCIFTLYKLYTNDNDNDDNDNNNNNNNNNNNDNNKEDNDDSNETNDEKNNNNDGVDVIYKNNDGDDLCLNPFLGSLIKLWKIFTNLVLLGLEIDRRVESLPDVSTPNIVKQVIRGSSAVRYVLAMILNDDVPNRFHDLNHVNILDFLSPYGRRNGTGSLHADVRWYIGAMLALGSDLKDVVEILIDLEPNDRYDEDVRYMFDYEFEDFHHHELFPEEHDDHLDDEPIMYEDEEGNFHRVVKPRCNCQFFDENDDEIFGSEYAHHSAQTEDGLSFTQPEGIAVRSSPEIEFDDYGRDWRDIPRGGNIFFNTNIDLKSENCYSWSELVNAFTEMSNTPVSDEVAARVISTIAKAVKHEFEEEINKTLKSDAEQSVDEEKVTPDKIYYSWSTNSLFELILTYNPLASYSMLDEMFMAHGYRRVLIWFITHMPLSLHLMNYVYELLIGSRGDSEGRIKQFEFSRQGALILSDVERSMLLHEFLNNCVIYLSKNFDDYVKHSNESDADINTSDFDKCIKIIKLVCLMINMLLKAKYIDLEEYKVELSSMFIDWVGIVPEARDLFFKLKKLNSNDTASFREKPVSRFKKFNKNLKVYLRNIVQKIDNGTMFFKPFFDFIETEDKDHDSDATAPSTKEFEIDLKAFKDSGTTEKKSNYIRGELIKKPVDEFYEREKIEQALGFAGE